MYDNKIKAYKVSFIILLLNCFHCESDLFVKSSTIARCDQDINNPCSASGRLTMRGWQLKKEISSIDSVCYKINQQSLSCKRPCGIYFQSFKLCASFFISSNLLNPIFPQTNFTWGESYSLSHPSTLSKFNLAKSMNWLIITILRYPTNRIISQYFATSETIEEYENLNLWINIHSLKKPRRGNDGHYKFWIELDNVYTKVFIFPIFFFFLDLICFTPIAILSCEICILFQQTTLLFAYVTISFIIIVYIIS